MSKVIAFHGPMGSGKSTAQKVLRSMLGDDKSRDLIECKFAGALYEIQNFIYDRIESVYQRPETFVKDRKLLQWVGTEWGRDTIDTNLWMKLWMNDVNSHVEYRHSVFCDDVRYANEVAAVREVGGILVKIKTKGNLERITTNNGIAGHTSEVELPDELFDHVIENYSTLAEFEAKLAALYQEFEFLQ